MADLLNKTETQTENDARISINSADTVIGGKTDEIPIPFTKKSTSPEQNNSVLNDKLNPSTISPNKTSGGNRETQEPLKTTHESLFNQTSSVLAIDRIEVNFPEEGASVDEIVNSLKSNVFNSRFNNNSPRFDINLRELNSEIIVSLLESKFFNTLSSEFKVSLKLPKDVEKVVNKLVKNPKSIILDIKDTNFKEQLEVYERAKKIYDAVYFKIHKGYKPEPIVNLNLRNLDINKQLKVLNSSTFKSFKEINKVSIQLPKKIENIISELKKNPNYSLTLEGSKSEISDQINSFIRAKKVYEALFGREKLNLTLNLNNLPPTQLKFVSQTKIAGPIINHFGNIQEETGFFICASSLSKIYTATFKVINSQLFFQGKKISAKVLKDASLFATEQINSDKSESESELLPRISFKIIDTDSYQVYLIKKELGDSCLLSFVKSVSYPVWLSELDEKSNYGDLPTQDETINIPINGKTVDEVSSELKDINNCLEATYEGPKANKNGRPKINLKHNSLSKRMFARLLKPIKPRNIINGFRLTKNSLKEEIALDLSGPSAIRVRKIDSLESLKIDGVKKVFLRIPKDEVSKKEVTSLKKVLNKSDLVNLETSYHNLGLIDEESNHLRNNFVRSSRSIILSNDDNANIVGLQKVYEELKATVHCYQTNSQGSKGLVRVFWPKNSDISLSRNAKKILNQIKQLHKKTLKADFGDSEYLDNTFKVTKISEKRLSRMKNQSIKKLAT